MKSRALPRKAARDTAHIAVPAVRGADFFLTWNCVHFANAEHSPASNGYVHPLDTDALSSVRPASCLETIYEKRRPTALQAPIVEEVREIKRRLAEMLVFGVRAMQEDVRKRESRGGHKAVSQRAK